MQSTKDTAALLKLAQVLRSTNSHDSDEKITEMICNKEGSNNIQIPSTFVGKLASEGLGNTILHLVALQTDKKALITLLDNGADFTIKNQAGLTALHNTSRINPSHLEEEIQFCECDNISWLFAAHMKFNNPANPCDNNGMSHFHIACISNDVEVIEFYLKNGVSISHTVNADSIQFAGYTPLHFAVRFCMLEATETLLRYGASTRAKDAKGMTPVHVLIEHKMHLYDLINANTEYQSVLPTAALMMKIERNERITSLVLQYNRTSDATFFDEVGLSRFHIACTMQDSSQAVSLLERVADIYHPVSANSSIWPGYTALHFAAHCNVKTVKILTARGASMEAKDANGVTPFDICVSKREIQDICFIVSRKLEWKYIQFSQSKIKLLDLLFDMESPNQLSEFLNDKDVNVCIPSNAPLWPGYTPLHLAVLFSERFNERIKSRGFDKTAQIFPLIEECLSRGADVTVQDARGSTPLHLAFKMNKQRVVERLLKAHRVAENPIDENGLSHLHIACAAECTEVVEQLANKENINVAYTGKTIFGDYSRCGYAPLHIAVASGSFEIVQILLNKGADINQFDAAGRTPVHAALGKRSCIGFELLKSTSLRNCVIPGANLSHLHVACRANSLDAVEKLIGLGADVNAAVVYDEKSDANGSFGLPFRRYGGWTPLHFAVEYGNFEVAKLLIERGADILAKSDDYDANDGKRVVECTPLSIVLKSRKDKIELMNLFVEALENDDSLRKRTERDFGITMLHLACFAVDVQAVKRLLKRRYNVNARVHENSAVWPGCTPLHVLMNLANERDVDEIATLLLKKGADVSLMNADGNTPIHLSFETYKVDGKEETDMHTSYCTQIVMPENSQVKTLMKAHKNYKVNPTNREGISHFHVAVAINDLDAARKFLKKKVDVNQATNYFNDCAAGYTPLHYAVDVLSHVTFRGLNEYEMVELLLEHGADANVEDVCGNTALHLATRANAPRDLLKILVDYGADVNKKNLCLQTPFELMLE